MSTLWGWLAALAFCGLVVVIYLRSEEAETLSAAQCRMRWVELAQVINDERAYDAAHPEYVGTTYWQQSRKGTTDLLAIHQRYCGRR